MVYAANTGVILYWKLDQPNYIRRYHHAWFDEYNSLLSTEEKRTSISLIIQQCPEIIIHNLYLLKLSPCELNITSTSFCDAIILTYEMELSPAGKKLVSFIG